MRAGFTGVTVYFSFPFGFKTGFLADAVDLVEYV